MLKDVCVFALKHEGVGDGGATGREQGESSRRWDGTKRQERTWSVFHWSRLDVPVLDSSLFITMRDTNTI